MIAIKRANWLPGIFNDFFGNEWIEKANATSPAVNIIENDDRFKLEIAAPGLNKEDFRIDIQEDGHLVISMEKKEEKKEEDGNKYLRREFSYVNFRQSMLLPDNVDKEKIGATVKDGVLVIDIPKKKDVEKQSPARQIKIS